MTGVAFRIQPVVTVFALQTKHTGLVMSWTLVTELEGRKR